MKRHGGREAADLPWQLVLESMIFAAEAEIRWLDHCETALLRSSAFVRPAGATRPPATGAATPADVRPPSGAQS